MDCCLTELIYEVYSDKVALKESFWYLRFFVVIVMSCCSLCSIEGHYLQIFLCKSQSSSWSTCTE